MQQYNNISKEQFYFGIICSYQMRTTERLSNLNKMRVQTYWKIFTVTDTVIWIVIFEKELFLKDKS